jgi:hypothetical protein
MPDIQFAFHDQSTEVAEFMQQVFPRAKWGLDGWTKLLAGRWARPSDPIAITVRDQGRLVGVLGLVMAQRPTPNGPCTTANMTSWYILQDYRGQGLGQRMIRHAMSLPNITVTDFTSSANAVGAVLAAGLQVLDDHRMVWLPRYDGDPVLSVVDLCPENLSQTDTETAQIIRDHDGLGLTSLLVQTADGPVSLIFSVKQKHDDYITHEVFYLSNHQRAADHMQAIANAVLPAQGAVMSVDPRFIPDSETIGMSSGYGKPARIEPTGVPRFYSPNGLPANRVDALYSEVVLMGMKLD